MNNDAEVLLVYASNEHRGFEFRDMKTTCILKVGRYRLSGSGQREKCRWKAVVNDLLQRGLLEKVDEWTFILTKKGFDLVEKISSKYDLSINPTEFLEDDGVSGKHIVEIKHKIETTIIDRTWIKDEEDINRLYHEPWRAFRCNNIILKDEKIEEPGYNNGLIKAEPYGLYNEGVLVFTSECSKKIKVFKKGIDGEENICEIEAYVLAKIPFRSISEIDPDGSINYPYPTLYCRFFNGNPYTGILYVDMTNGFSYEEDEIYMA